MKQCIPKAAGRSGEKTRFRYGVERLFPGGGRLTALRRYAPPVLDVTNGSSMYTVEVEVSVLDGKTHFPLWTVIQPIQRAVRESTAEKNFSDAIAALVSQFKGLTTAPTQAP